MPTLAEFVDGHSPVAKELPFVHSTRCEVFPNLCADGNLATQACPVFGEPLLYFFYGRPAFRSVKNKKLAATKVDLLPICFIFKPGVLDAYLHRVFPFDTGAAQRDIFSPHIKPADLKDFQLNPALLSIKKAIAAFFETNEKYFLAHPRSTLPIPGGTGISTVDCYSSLITTEGEAKYDDRRAAIEVQTATPINLQNTLLSVVLPAPFLDEPGVRDTILGKWGAYPLRYNHIRGTFPSEYVRVIVQKVGDYLEKGGYF